MWQLMSYLQSNSDVACQNVFMWGETLVFSDAFVYLIHIWLAFWLYFFNIHCILVVQFASDREPIVADSCVVALDMLEFENSGEFEYASKA